MKKIKLINGGVAIVDDADYEWLNIYIWRLSDSGYAINDIIISKLCQAPISPILSMSRLILGLELGDKREADHINHITLDNRRCNLRSCTHAENQHNRSLTKRKTSSQFKGVHWHKQAKKWQARIWNNGVRIHLGCFSKEKYAAQAYNLATKKYHKKFAFLNVI